jgi:hypothetical protein
METELIAFVASFTSSVTCYFFFIQPKLTSQ